MQWKRILRHLLAPNWVVKRAFSQGTMSAIERAIAASESTHEGELRFAIEAGLPIDALLRGQTARQRAVEVFSRLRVWDTEHNSGVLIYLQFIDRKVEILADRGINARVAQEEWDGVCRRMERHFRERNFEAGALAAIGETSALLAAHFPARRENPNELPDRPLIL
jgi:uncharacterized membrane protein